MGGPAYIGHFSIDVTTGRNDGVVRHDNREDRLQIHGTALRAGPYRNCIQKLHRDLLTLLDAVFGYAVLRKRSAVLELRLVISETGGEAGGDAQSYRATSIERHMSGVKVMVIQWVTPMIARVYVSMKPTVLDPQGQTIRSALAGLAHTSITSVRQGKYFEITLEPGTDREKAHAEIEQIAHEVLANPVIEEYRIEWVI